MRRFILALILILMSLSAPGVAQTSRRWEPVKGINLAWLDGAYGHDFAPNPQHLDWGFDYKRESLDRAFRDIESMRMNVVRIFVFEDLEGLFFGLLSRICGCFLARVAGQDCAKGLCWFTVNWNFRGWAQVRGRNIL